MRPLPRPSTAGPLATLALFAALACAPSDDDTADTTGGPSGAPPAPTPGAVEISRQRSEDLTGDGRAERFTLTARGPTIDSLDVRLEIRSPEDALLYAASWRSELYFTYDDRGAMTDSAAGAKVRAHLDRVLASEAFASGPLGTVRDTMRLTMMRDAIRYDIAKADWRAQHGLAPGAPLPPESHDPIEVLARAVPAARIETLVRELEGRPSFKYFSGGEETTAIAWSERERRFVTIFSCC
jgi:hypothetical protein